MQSDMQKVVQSECMFSLFALKLASLDIPCKSPSRFIRTFRAQYFSLDALDSEYVFDSHINGLMCMFVFYYSLQAASHMYHSVSLLTRYNTHSHHATTTTDQCVGGAWNATGSALHSQQTTSPPPKQQHSIHSGPS